MTASAPHSDLYLAGDADHGFRLEAIGGQPRASGLKTLDDARQTAWRAGYRHGGKLADGTEWWGYATPGQPAGERRPGPVGTALDGAACGFAGAFVFAALLSLPWPT